MSSGSNKRSRNLISVTSLDSGNLTKKTNNNKSTTIHENDAEDVTILSSGDDDNDVFSSEGEDLTKQNTNSRLLKFLSIL